VVLFRAEIVRSRPDFFPPGRIYFDTDVCYELSSAWDFGFVHEVLTFLRVDDASITGRALPYNPWLLCKLLLVRTYGQRHLGAAEYRKCLRAISGQYYRYLGQAVLRRRGAPFWEYHARGLATIGERLSAGSLALHAGRALLQLALHPVESGKGLRAERLLRRRNR
jgi:hypothetical protein